MHMATQTPLADESLEIQEPLRFTTADIATIALDMADDFGHKLKVDLYRPEMKTVLSEDIPGLTKAIILEAANPNGVMIVAKYHDEQVANRLKDGWRYGSGKEDYTHPELLPFTQLPKNVQSKAIFFRTVVVSLAPFWAAY